jgi:hypothetical protein
MSASVENLKRGPGVVQLWVGLLAGPLAALIQLEVNYALVPWVCNSKQTWTLHLVSLIALMVATAAGTLAFVNSLWLCVRFDDDGAGSIPRSRLMAAVGVLMSALTSLVIIAQWLPVFLYGPCQR